MDMKSIIDGKVYNTEYSKLLAACQYDNGLIDQLYICSSGDYFLYGGLHNQIRPLYPITAECWSQQFAGRGVYMEVCRLNNLLK